MSWPSQFRWRTSPSCASAVLQAFEEHFPEALDLLGRAVRAGHAFTTGLEMVAKESPEPVAGEFRTTFEEQNFGLPLARRPGQHGRARSLRSTCASSSPLCWFKRKPAVTSPKFSTSLRALIRDRFRIYREVQVKTAQGRLTAGILIALPFMMLIVMEFLNPAVRQDSVDRSDRSRSCLIGARLLADSSGLCLWKIVQIEV